MGKIFYAVSGEGRGHAVRAWTLVEELRRDHEIVLYAPGHALELLAPRYRASEVEVRPLPGLRFHYSAHHRLAWAPTAWHSLGYLAALPQLVRRLADEVARERPDLVVSDFEPALPRAARRCGVPFISLDHQHFLLTYDLSCLPSALRWHAAFMAGFVRAWYRGQVHSIVSSFYFPPLRRGLDRVTQTGVLLRPEVLRARPEPGAHVVAYLRRFGEPRVLHALAGCGHEVRIYGLGERPATGRLRFCAIDGERFVADLAASRALVTTAGNQLVGEALYLGKPVLAMPERGNREQEINAFFLHRSGAGEAVAVDTMTPARVRAFLAGADHLASRIDRRRLHGNPAALAVIRDHLVSRPAAPLPVRVPA